MFTSKFTKKSAKKTTQDPPSGRPSDQKGGPKGARAPGKERASKSPLTNWKTTTRQDDASQPRDFKGKSKL